MIRRKKYLKNHNPDGSFKPFGGRGGGGGGGRGNGGQRRRPFAALEAEIAELKRQNKDLEQGAGNDADDSDDGGNANNPALEAHGRTRNKIQRRGGK